MLSKSKSPARLLFIAPHPDDEIVSGYGIISLARRLNWNVRIIVVTDGTASHRNSPRFTNKRLLKVREKETVKGLCQLGVAKSNILFCQLPDGGLDSCSQRRIEQQFVRPLRQQAASSNIIIGPGIKDAHPDHANVGQIVSDYIPPQKLWTYITWKQSMGTAQNIFVLPTNSALKRAALKRYRTQCGHIDDDPLGFSFTRMQLHQFCRPFEHFRRML